MKSRSTNFMRYLAGTPVPEPATYAGILGTLALGLAAMKRRVRR